MEWLHKLLKRWFLPYRWLIKVLLRIPFPGNRRANMAQVLGYFLLKLPDESLTIRASAVAFNFFLAVFPALIFLFTLLPYFPVKELQPAIMSFFHGAVPEYVFVTINETLNDILLTKRTGLLSFGIVVTIYFASNGISSLLAAFHPQGSFWSQKLISLLLVFVVSIMVIVAVSINLFSEHILQFLAKEVVVIDNITSVILTLLRWLITLSLVYFIVALLYFAGTPKEQRLHFFSPGTWLSTLSILLISYIYSYYVENFAQYNKLYGSLGTIIMTMLWMYFCALVVMIWYIYNQSHKNFKA